MEIHAQTKRVIYCQRSGVALLEVETLCSNGWALLSQPTFGTFVHPIYNLNLGKLIRKLELQLIDADAAEFDLTVVQLRELALSMSAIMYSIDAMWMPTKEALENGRNIESSLPATNIVIGCADRLLQLASWYHFETSRRLRFPLWKPSKAAGNLNWHGFPAWLDACNEIKEDWENNVRKAERRDLLDATENALATVHLASVYKRIDINKVWNWIELQACDYSAQYPAGRRETLKTLFTIGDEHPEDWMPDDCDDLIEMVTLTCDIGNDITHYIRNRVSLIRRSINDFYSSFTIIGRRSTDNSNGLDLSEAEKTAQDSLMTEYETKLGDAITMPPKPVATDFTNKVLWLKAQAEWNILNRVFAARGKSAI